MARKIFTAVGGGYTSLFYAAGQIDRNSRWMCIATGVAFIVGVNGLVAIIRQAYMTAKKQS
jgi:hypothetical protein